MAPRTEVTYCRLCSAFCGLEIDVEDGSAVAVRGDREHALSEGFTCAKAARSAHSRPIRPGS